MKHLKKLVILLMALMMSVGVAYGAVACDNDKDSSSKKQSSSDLGGNDVPDNWGDRSDLA